MLLWNLPGANDPSRHQQPAQPPHRQARALMDLSTALDLRARLPLLPRQLRHTQPLQQGQAGAGSVAKHRHLTPSKPLHEHAPARHETRRKQGCPALPSASQLLMRLQRQLAQLLAAPLR